MTMTQRDSAGHPGGLPLRNPQKCTGGGASGKEMPQRRHPRQQMGPEAAPLSRTRAPQKTPFQLPGLDPVAAAGVPATRRAAAPSAQPGLCPHPRAQRACGAQDFRGTWLPLPSACSTLRALGGLSAKRHHCPSGAFIAHPALKSSLGRPRPAPPLLTSLSACAPLPASLAGRSQPPYSLPAPLLLPLSSLSPSPFPHQATYFLCTLAPSPSSPFPPAILSQDPCWPHFPPASPVF